MPLARSIVTPVHAAGAGKGQAGSGHNYVCLHPTPNYMYTTPKAESAGGRLYRAEYDTGTRGLWRLWRLHGDDVPCAVCQTTGSLATLMQPGSTKCPAGWSIEYLGFAMAATYNLP